MKKNPIKYNNERISYELKMIVDMIDASYQLAAKKGPHALEKGCNCITCVNKRKRLLVSGHKEWTYRI